MGKETLNDFPTVSLGLRDNQNPPSHSFPHCFSIEPSSFSVPDFQQL